MNLMAEFSDLPPDALITPAMLAELRFCSVATLERERLAGRGVPVIKAGDRQYRYRKADYISWLNSQKTQSEQKAKP